MVQHYSKQRPIEVYRVRPDGTRGRLNAWSGENAAWMDDSISGPVLRSKLLAHAHRAVYAWQGVFPNDKIELTGG